MRGVVAGLFVAILLMAVSVAAAAVGALGVAAIGWLLHRWFELTIFQGAVLALGVMGILVFLLYKLAAQPSAPTVIFDEDLEDALHAKAFGESDDEESSVVAWRRSRAAQHSPSARRRGSK